MYNFSPPLTLGPVLSVMGVPRPPENRSEISELGAVMVQYGS